VSIVALAKMDHSLSYLKTAPAGSFVADICVTTPWATRPIDTVTIITEPGVQRNLEIQYVSESGGAFACVPEK
jgi:hypothetical protein